MTRKKQSLKKEHQAGKMRYLHLDMKGILSSEEKIIKWFSYFKKCGFEGLVLEYDCRIDWDTWPGAAISLLTKDAVKRILAHAAELGLDVIPLIQVHGHIQWILKHDMYAHLRENGFINELCPLHPESAVLMRRWIDEVIEMHPDAKIIHLGSDETWNLGSCPKCMAAIESDRKRRDKMGIFTDHVSALCRYVAEKGMRPMIWADMFWRDGYCPTKVFPPETILVHWSYGQSVETHLDMLQSTGLDIWGASAVRCSWNSHLLRMLNDQTQRIRNIMLWEKTGLPVIHTTWGRPSNLYNLYGPWEACIPAFIAAGNPAAWEAHPWRLFVAALDKAVAGTDVAEMEFLLNEAGKLSAADEFEEQSLRWFRLGLRFEIMKVGAINMSLCNRCMDVLQKYHGRDGADYEKWFAGPVKSLKNDLSAWTRDLKIFWDDNVLSDFDEYLETRRSSLLDIL